MTTISDLRKKLDAKEISSVELTKEYLSKIEKHSNLGAFNTVCHDEALAAAEIADKMISDGSVSPLTGIPMAIKDNICTKDIKTTCSSKMLSDYKPPYNATVMEKLNAQGIVTLGKTSMDEFAMGGSSQTSALAKPKNPFNTE